MSYVKSVIQPDEKIIAVGRVSWVVYHRAILLAVLGVVLIIVESIVHGQTQSWTYLVYFTAALFTAATLISAAQAWFIRWTTEIAVTNKRVIYKRGFINRHTVEMNMDKVATVDVDQSILGRMFDFGSIRIVGTGGTQGIERLDRIGAPLALRTAIEVK